MGLYRPGGAVGAGGTAADLYIKNTDDATITGDWNFTGAITQNGSPLGSSSKYVLQATTGVLASNAKASITVTHGLGTDNVAVFVMMYSTDNLWAAMWTLVDGYDAAMAKGVNPPAFTPIVPLTGTINLQIKNASGNADTIFYQVFVQAT